MKLSCCVVFETSLFSNLKCFIVNVQTLSNLEKSVFLPRTIHIFITTKWLPYPWVTFH